MDFKQCALIFTRYPTPQKWIEFFKFHYPFWYFFTSNVQELFPVNISYPSTEEIPLLIEDYHKKSQSISTLEDFFALYFLLINFSHNQNASSITFFRDQEIWKHLWDREFWQSRVTEENLVASLKKLKSQLQDSSPIYSELL